MILVTGATGTIGSEVVRRLLAAEERPRAFVRDPDKAREQFGERVEHFAGDFDRPESIEAALSGVDRVFLLTRQNSRQPDWERGLVNAAANAGVNHVVKLSVFRADEESPLQVARQHRQAERVLEESGLAFTIVRPVFFMQNVRAMIRDGCIYTAAGDGRVAMVDAGDVAAVAVAALIDPAVRGRTYTLTGPEALTFDEVARTVGDRTGTPIRHVRVSEERVRSGLEAAGAPPWFGSDMARLHRMLAGGYENVVTDDVRAVTGEPPRAFAHFVSQMAV